MSTNSGYIVVGPLVPPKMVEVAMVPRNRPTGPGYTYVAYPSRKPPEK
jgi:hypothetical protein